MTTSSQLLILSMCIFLTPSKFFAKQTQSLNLANFMLKSIKIRTYDQIALMPCYILCSAYNRLVFRYIAFLQLSSDSYYVIKVYCLVRFRAITCVSSVPDICVLSQLAHCQDYSSLSNMSKYQTYYTTVNSLQGTLCLFGQSL